MSTPFALPLDPDDAPSPITPSDSPPGRPDAPADGWEGTAPYDISAPQDIDGLNAACEAAGRLTGAGVVYPASERQHAAEGLLQSPLGAPAMSIMQGFYNTLPGMGAMPDGPIQGEGGGYPGTMQEGISQFMSGLGTGVDGVPPEGGNMGPGGGDYPGTIQSGLQKYGTS